MSEYPCKCGTSTCDRKLTFDNYRNQAIILSDAVWLTPADAILAGEELIRLGREARGEGDNA